MERHAADSLMLIRLRLEILTLLPGMDPQKAQAIVTRREQRPAR